MAYDIKEFVESYLTCQLEKIDHTMKREVSSPWSYQRPNGKELASALLWICHQKEIQGLHNDSGGSCNQNGALDPLHKDHYSKRGCTIVLAARDQVAWSSSGNLH